MATVFRAFDQTGGGLVAIKVLSKDFLTRNPKEAERNLRRFRREADILKLLVGDAHVVQFVDQGTTEDGEHYIAMELLVGEQLRFHIGRGRNAMGLRTFVYHARLITEGLAAIHAKKLLHRDLAPDNIFIVKTKEGLPWPKFLDFGIGKSLTDNLDQVTQMLTIMGKPQYFSPEQARGQELTAPADVYALGVVLYEMVTGYVPLEIHGIADLRKIQKEPPIPISNYREGLRLPEDLRNVIMRCLAKKPEERPALAEVLATLDRFQVRLEAGEEFPLPASATSGTPTSTEAIAPSTQSEGSAVSSAASSAAFTKEFSAGDNIGRFQVKQKIGRGGMGAVYLAWDPILHREVAIKVASRVEEEKARRAVLREARASSHLSSENVVTIYEAGTEGGAPYIAMEYVRGPTLADVIEKEGFLGGDRFWTFAQGICEGLIYAHENPKPIIHRDLKPANILCANETAKITDFGIATVAAGKSGPAVSDQTGSVGGAEGSALTISPEQANNKPVDHRSDIYSLGCVFYMMATGRAPFQGNQIAILYQHSTKTPDPPQKVNPKLAPVALGPIILKCLEKDPAQRYQSVREIKADLEALFVPRSTVERPWHRSPLVLASLAAVLAAAGILFWTFFIRKPPEVVTRFDVVRIGGEPFRPDAGPTFSYVVTTDSVPLRISATTDVQLIATVTSKTDKTIGPPQTISVMAGDPQPLNLVLGKGSGETDDYDVTIERSDKQGEPITFHVLRDVSRPTIAVQTYGAPFVPNGPVRVIRSLRHLNVVVTDPAGFDEAGAEKTVKLAATASRLGRIESELLPPETDSNLRKLRVKASDRANNASEMLADVQFITPAIEFKKPSTTTPTRNRKVPVEIVARVAAKDGVVPGISAADIDLGERGTFAITVRSGSEVVEKKIELKRAQVGYAGEFELPEKLGTDFDFSIEVSVDDEVLAESGTRFTFDRTPPSIRATCGSTTAVSDAAPKPDMPEMALLGGQTLADAIRCKLDDHGRTVRGATIDVTTDPGTTTRVTVDANGDFTLPPTEAEKFKVHAVARDLAGNEATLDFRVVRKGTQVSGLRLGTDAFDMGARVYVKADGMPLSVTVLEVSPGDRVFATLLDSTGTKPIGAPVPLERSVKDAKVWEIGRLPLGLEGATAAVRKLRVSVGKAAASAQPSPKDATIHYDNEPPRIDISTGTDGQDVIKSGTTRNISRWKPITIRVTDNVGLNEFNPSTAVTITGGDPSAVPTIMPAPQPASQPVDGPKDVTIVLGPPEKAVDGRYVLAVVARDNAGAETRASITLDVVTVAVELLEVNNDAEAAKSTSVDAPKAVNSDAISLKVKVAPNQSVQRQLAIRVFPEDSEKGIDLAPATLPPDGSPAFAYTFKLPRSRPAPAERGRITLSVKMTGTSGSESLDLPPVYYIIDSLPPEYEVWRDGEKQDVSKRDDWIKVAKMSSLRLIVTDGQGSGIPDGAFTRAEMKTPAEFRVERRDPATIAISFSDAGELKDLQELNFEARDRAGNVTPIRLRVGKAKDAPSADIAADAGQRHQLPDNTYVLRGTKVKLVFTNETVVVRRARFEVTKGGKSVMSDVVELNEKVTSKTIDLGENANGDLEVRYWALRATGDDPEPFQRHHLRFDQTPPTLSVTSGGAAVTSGASLTVASAGDVQIETSDDVTKGAIKPVVSVVPSDSAAGADETTAGAFRLRIPSLRPGGRVDVTVRAEDAVGNATSLTFGLQIPAPTERPTPVVPTPAPVVRSLDNETVRQEDQARTGITFVPVYDRVTPGRGGTPVFYMSQTEVTNEQFLRFAAAYRAKTIPSELVKGATRAGQSAVEELAASLSGLRPEDLKLPVVKLNGQMAQSVAAWAGGRIPTAIEWRGAAGRYLKADADWPVYIEDDGSVKSDTSFFLRENFAVFRPTRGEPSLSTVDQLLAGQRHCPFGIVGLPGNASEWVADENGLAVGVLGGSYNYAPSSNIHARLDKPHYSPTNSNRDAGVRIVWPKKDR